MDGGLVYWIVTHCSSVDIDNDVLSRRVFGQPSNGAVSVGA